MMLAILLVLQQILGGTVTVSMQATDPSAPGQTTSGIASVQCLLDGAPLSAVLTTPTTPPNTYSFLWNTTLNANGPHTLTARAIDNAGNVGSAALTVSVLNVSPDTTAPVIQFITPIAGVPVSGKVNVAANASDNVRVSQMQLFIRGQLKKTVNAPSLTYNWNTSPDKKFSPVTLTVTAIDAAGNLSNSAVTVPIQ